ncbi:MAG: hypothetical protein LBK96_01695 [Prevotellaceae bacterium]|nr:hypothetical protein [Prevotellaceae bacterium]
MKFYSNDRNRNISHIHRNRQSGDLTARLNDPIARLSDPIETLNDLTG